MAAVTSSPPQSHHQSSSPYPTMDRDLLNVTVPGSIGNDTDDERNEGLAVIEVAISGTILFLAVAGNSIVVVSLMVKRGKLSRMHLMMLHLSLADLSVAFFQVLPQMVWDITFRFQGGAFLCGAVKYLQLVTMYGSSYVLLSTAVDRYVAICRPFLSQKWTSTHAHLLVLAAWLASLVFSLPQIFIFSLSEVGEGTGVYDCWASFHPPWTLKLYIAWNALSVFLTPSMTLAVLYGHITLTVWRSSKMAENLAHRYKPVSKGPKEAEKSPPQSKKAADLTQGVSAWHNKSDGEAFTYPLQNLNHSSSSHDLETHQNSPATKPWNGQHYSAQKFPAGHHKSHAALTQTFSDCRGCHSQGKTTSCSFTNVPCSTRYSGDKTHLEDTFRKGRSQDSRNSTFSTRPNPGNSWSEDRQKVGVSRNLQENGHIMDSQRSGASRLSHGSPGTSRSLTWKGSTQDAHTWGTKRGTGGGGVGISRAKMKTIKLTLTVVICYLVCWTPFYVAQLWAAYDENVPYDSIFFTLVLLLASVNSCTNPWIYMVFSDTICNTLRAIADSLPCFRSSSRCPPQSSTRGRHSVLSSERTSTTARGNHAHVNGVSRI